MIFLRFLGGDDECEIKCSTRDGVLTKITDISQEKDGLIFIFDNLTNPHIKLTVGELRKYLENNSLSKKWKSISVRIVSGSKIKIERLYYSKKDQCVLVSVDVTSTVLLSEDLPTLESFNNTDEKLEEFRSTFRSNTLMEMNKKLTK